jgi:hypothetical protein
MKDESAKGKCGRKVANRESSTDHRRQTIMGCERFAGM